MKSQRIVVWFAVCSAASHCGALRRRSVGRLRAARQEIERIPRLFPPAIDAKAAGAKAIKLYDANNDGKLSGEELDKCPGLKAAIDQVDPSGKGEITADDDYRQDQGVAGFKTRSDDA